MSSLSVTALVSLGLVGSAHAWGWQGHGMVGSIAETLLTDKAAAKVKSILENDDCGPEAPCKYGATLEGCSSWADDIKHESEWAWTAQVHFINTPDSSDLSDCSYDYDRDCKDDDLGKGYCSAGGINNYTKQLHDAQINARQMLLTAEELQADEEDQHDVTKGRLAPHSALIPTEMMANTTSTCRGAGSSYKSCSDGCTYIRSSNEGQCGVKKWGCYDCSKLSSSCPDCGSTPGPGPTPSGGGNQACAVKFLDHFIGDIHQPLHVGFTSDLGGNHEYCSWFGETKDTYPIELHGVWDFNIIEKYLKDNGMTSSQWAAALAANITDAQKKEWGTCKDASALACPDEWASESIAAACGTAYVGEDGKPIAFKTGFSLGDKYYQKALPVLAQRIQQGGVRLASTFNRIFA